MHLDLETHNYRKGSNMFLVATEGHIQKFWPYFVLGVLPMHVKKCLENSRALTYSWSVPS